MKQKSVPGKAPADQVIKDIRRQTRRHYSAEEKIRIVLEGLRGEENISELCRREGIAASIYYGCGFRVDEFISKRDRKIHGSHGSDGNSSRTFSTDFPRVYVPCFGFVLPTTARCALFRK